MWSGFGTRNETRLRSSWDIKMIDAANFTCMDREIERAIAAVIITRYPSLAEGKHNQEKKKINDTDTHVHVHFRRPS